jgi:hypothetical protein
VRPPGETKKPVEMVHYVCDVCSVSATCVHNVSSDLAWLDHMTNHADQSLFHVYTWEVLPIPFDPTAVVN